MRRRIALTVTVLVLVAAGVAVMVARRAARQSSETAATVAAGKAIYQAQCAVCHGDRGNGKGSIAYLLSPRPRDFTRAVFKFRSTPSGELPTDADLLRTLDNGVPGTSMPSWAQLTDAERRAVIAHIKTFSNEWKERTPAAPIAIGKAPSCASLTDRGAQVYVKAGCAKCHGEGGKGDGPSSTTLKDDRGDPIRAYDFTHGGRMKGGSKLEDIYRTFSTGLSGTPMPAYQGSYPDEDLWALACFVQELGKSGAPPPAPSRELVIAREQLPPSVTPDDTIFDRATPATVLLRALYARDAAPDAAEVRAVSDGKRLAVRVEWRDSSQDARPLRIEDFRDGVALEFPLQQGEGAAERSFYGMGMHSGPVNIWHWKADWQLELSSQIAGKATAVRAGAVGNAMAAAKRSSPIEDLNAIGPGSLTPQPAAEQNVSGTGAWRDGRWRVVFVRDIETRYGGDADLRTAGKLAVAVWDGSARDRDGQKSVSEWLPYRFDGVKN
ncbi:MAG: c-type cytochrome [Acidobacteria bacterium]|nr:c-type cytochrome [Acidobacteriota bacterium]